jgi:hypothetical protein
MRFCNLCSKILRNKIFWVLLFLIVINIVYVQRCQLKLGDSVLTDAAGNQTSITLPYTAQMAATEYTISGNVYSHGFLNLNLIHIVPDDEVLSIRVNQREIPLNGVKPESLRDYVKGFDFPLGRYLQPGNNEVEIRIRNNGGDSGLSFGNSPYNIADWLLWFLICALLYLILSHFIPNKVLILILLGGLLIRIAYFWVTPVGIRDYDGWDHVVYIKYIVEHGSIPPRHYSWEAYQPPFYYGAAALVYDVAKIAGVQGDRNLIRVVQFFSIPLFMGFLLASLGIFQTLFAHLSRFQQELTESEGNHSPSPNNKYQTWIIAVIFGLITFWPSGILHSTRIGNDGMFYLLYAWGLYYLLKWWYEGKTGYLYGSILLAALGFITKANGAVLFGVIGLVYLWRAIQERKVKRYLIKAFIILIMFGMGFWITFGAAVEEKLQGSKYQFMVPNVSDWDYSSQVVENKLVNYLGFDLGAFVKEPYVYPFEEKGARSLFWNYLFKTGVIGEFRVEAPFEQWVAMGLSVIFLGLMVFSVIGFIEILRKEFSQHLVLFWSMVLLLVAAILFRMWIPLSCSQEFRYIFPLLISSCFFYGYTLLICQKKGWRGLERVGYTLAVLMMGGGIAFFVGLVV